MRLEVALEPGESVSFHNYERGAMQPAQEVTPEIYLKLDAVSEARHEYWDGRVVAMAGAEPEHNKITANLTFELMARLRDRGCSVVSSDQRVQVGLRYVYPDVVATCGKEDFLDTTPRTLLNPTLLVEVLSASTHETDVEEKLLAYTRLESLQEYWMVSSARPLVMRYVRRGEDWILYAAMGLEAVLRSEHLGVEIPMPDVYRLVIER